MGRGDVRVNLSLSVSSGAVEGRRRCLSCSLGAVWEDGRLKIPHENNKNNKSAPATEQRAPNGEQRDRSVSVATKKEAS